jgi:glycosyltransferase 2 family protein
MASSLRTHLNIGIGIIISAVAIYLSFRKIDFHTLGLSLVSINFFWFIPVVLAQLCCFTLKGLSWRFLLMPARKGIPLRSTTTVLIIGLMVNDIFPAKMGELARAYLLGEREKLSKSLCLSTIMVEHLLDILVLSIFLLILLPAVTLPYWLRTSGTLVGVVALGIIVALFLVVRREEKFLNWLERLLILLPDRFRGKVQDILNKFLQGFRVITGRYIFYSFASLFSMWVIVFVVAYLVMAAFGLYLPVYAPIMVVIFTAFGKIIPSSPGAIGTFHYLVIVVLMAFGVGKEVALSYAIVLHAFGVLIEVSLGTILVLTGNLSLSRITHPTESSP